MRRHRLLLFLACLSGIVLLSAFVAGWFCRWEYVRMHTPDSVAKEIKMRLRDRPTNARRY
jgi:hypothetical protein